MEEIRGIASFEESALVILVPEVDELKRRFLLNGQDCVCDPSLAHITILYPFAAACFWSDRTFSRLSDVARRSPPFSFQLRSSRASRESYFARPQPFPNFLRTTG